MLTVYASHVLEPAAQPRLTQHDLAGCPETLFSVKASGTGSAFQAVSALFLEQLLKHLP